MHVRKDHTPRKGGDGVGDTVLHASLTSRLQAQVDNRANVFLNDLGQRRVVFGMVFFFLLAQAARLHKIKALLLMIFRLGLLTVTFCRKSIRNPRQCPYASLAPNSGGVRHLVKLPFRFAQ